MKILSIENNQTTPTTFRSYTISPQARQLIKNNPEKLEIAQRAERLFKNSRHIDFEILDGFVPNLKIKKTGENLLGEIKAMLIQFSNGIRISDNKTVIDFVLPEKYVAKNEEVIINHKLNDNVAKATRIGELIKISAEDHHGNFLI